MLTINKNNKQSSFHSILYNKIPKKHTLRLISEEIDFSFINTLLEDSYCKHFGRPAKEPELMVKLLVLQHLYNLSDEQVIEDATLHLAYLYFLDLNPEDPLPHPSLLAKFRVHRLQDISLDEIIIEIIKQCVEKGIIESTAISVDSTHTQANTRKAIPERVMKHLSKEIFKTVNEENGEVPATINQEIPEYREIDDHKEAKETMKSYLEGTIEKLEDTIELERYPKTKRIIENAKEILEDPKFMASKGVRSIIDQEARVGRKSRTENFFGYKEEIMMLPDVRIITAVHVGNGAYVDGTEFQKLLDLTVRTGINIKEFYGDKAYFKKVILDTITKLKAKPYVPVSEMVYRIDEDRFSYNKDSDEWFCEQGNKTFKKSYKQRKDGRQSYKYYFDRELCRDCPLRDSCIKGKTVGKILEVGINTPEFYGYSQEQKTEEFKEKYKNRASQEWKNGEMKNFHGLDRARGYGLKSMERQAKLTALAVNLKRIAGMLSSLNTSNFRRYSIFWLKSKRLEKLPKKITE